MNFTNVDGKFEWILNPTTGFLGGVSGLSVTQSHSLVSTCWSISLSASVTQGINLWTYSRVTVSKSNLTYLFTPQSTIRSLFDAFGLNFPEDLQRPFDFSTVVDPMDILPRGLNNSDISLGGASVSYH